MSSADTCLKRLNSHRSAQRLIDDAEENGSRKHQAIGRRLAAETSRRKGDHATALASIDHAAKVAESIGNPTQRWSCYAEGAALELSTTNGPPPI